MPATGDISIVGILDTVLSLQCRLGFIWDMAEVIAEGICLACLLPKVYTLLAEKEVSRL